MASISPNLAHLTDELPADRRADIEAAMASSPYLQQIMTEAVDSGMLKHIRLSNPGANEGGSYHSDKKAIYISPDTFTRAAFRSDPQTRLDVITSTLGHETGHALYTQKAEKERYAASYAITEGIRAAGQDGEFDATQIVGAYIRSARRDEALAEIHGWNALASRIEYTKGRPPGRDEMLERAQPTTDCIVEERGVRTTAPGILLDPDMQMSDHRIPKRGPINLEPVAQCHFDQSRAALGKGGAANYPNYYGGYLIEQLADDTRGWVQPPSIKLDMAKLGLDKAQLESTGLRLPAEGFSIIDISQGRYRPIVLRSSGSGMQGTPDSIDTAALDQARPSPVLMTEPTHAAHGMYLRAQQVLSQIELAPGMGGLTQHERQALGASVVATSLSAEGWKFTGFDHAVPGRIDPQTGRPETVFLVQGALDDPAHQRIAINMDQALSQSLEQSSAVSQTVMQAREQTMQQAQQLAQQQEQDGPKGPAMRIGPRTLSPQGPQSDAGGGDGGGG
ncbi:MAG: hypothetical protein KF800_00755 [Lysobacter sp.]|nr:hypothetical protein [Lysobacter sp.]